MDTLLGANLDRLAPLPSPLSSSFSSFVNVKFLLDLSFSFVLSFHTFSFLGCETFQKTFNGAYVCFSSIYQWNVVGYMPLAPLCRLTGHTWLSELLWASVLGLIHDTGCVLPRIPWPVCHYPLYCRLSWCAWVCGLLALETRWMYW